MAMTTLSTTIDADNAGRVDLVVRQLSGSSRSQVRGMVDHGCVSINGAPCETVAATVAAGDCRFDSLRSDAALSREKETLGRSHIQHFVRGRSFDCRGQVRRNIDRADRPQRETTRWSNVFRVYLSHSRRKRQAWLVHRLDREVSGLLVFGKHEPIADRLIEQFKQRKPQRVYTAIVAGVMSSDEGTFHSHLATGKNLDRYVARPSRKTELAITHYRVLRRMSDTTLVEATLETGKRNQIRVHFADAGHPVLGDPRYKTKPGHASAMDSQADRVARQVTRLRASGLRRSDDVRITPAFGDRKFLAGSR